MMQQNDFDDMDIPELENSDINGNITHNRRGEWINSESKPLKQIDCYISRDILERVRDLQYSIDRKFKVSNEFGGYLKWHWQEGCVVIDDFMIPQQVVGGATVDFKSEAPADYTGVFHKHPTGCKSFSGVDDTYINSNNAVSILFEGGTFVTGIVNIDIPGGYRFQTKLRICIEQRHDQRKDVDISMIHAYRPQFPHRSAVQEINVLPPDSLFRQSNFESLLEPETDEDDGEIEVICDDSETLF